MSALVASADVSEDPQQSVIKEAMAAILDLSDEEEAEPGAEEDLPSELSEAEALSCLASMAQRSWHEAKWLPPRRSTEGTEACRMQTSRRSVCSGGLKTSRKGPNVPYAS